MMVFKFPFIEAFRVEVDGVCGFRTGDIDGGLTFPFIVQIELSDVLGIVLLFSREIKSSLIVDSCRNCTMLVFDTNGGVEVWYIFHPYWNW